MKLVVLFVTFCIAITVSGMQHSLRYEGRANTTVNAPFIGALPVADGNVDSMVNVAINTPAAVVVCIDEIVPSVEHYDSCAFYHKFDKENSTEVGFAMRGGVSYFVAVYPQKPTKDVFTADVDINGVYCNAGEYRENCTTVPTLPTTPITVQAASTETFTFESSMNPASIEIAAHGATVDIFYRFSSSPFTTGGNMIYDASGSTLYSPQNGVWYVTFENKGDKAVSFGINKTENHCAANKTGSDCKDSITSLNQTAFNSKPNTLKKKGDVAYYQVNAAFDALLVGVGQEDSKQAPLQIFASFNRVPIIVDGKIAQGSADLSGCNVGGCGAVKAFATNMSVPTDQNDGTWFVAVVATKENVNYGIWTGSVCPADCSKQGTCAYEGDDYGVCKCANVQIYGLGCEQQNDLRVEIIILVVIALLVLVSAVIGLIAWVYMRKRAHYIEY